MENKRAHLEIIQGVINRLSHNSFLLKGWSVVIIAALFALSAANTTGKFALLALLPAFVFWGLDGYFLRQEKLFRKLYDNVRVIEEDKIDFDMNTKTVDKEVDNWLWVAFSKTLFPFHGILILAIFVVFYWQE